MKIGVIGLGLIGGSIFKNLRNKNKIEVIGVSRTVKEQNVSYNYDTLKTCDVVFVCTPMNKTLEILEKLNSILGKNTIVTDVCSLKEFVSNKEYNYEFIPSHPMAGTEHSGWDYSFAELFEGAKWVITPNEFNSESSIKILENLVVSMGAKPVFANPKRHDEAVALISHLPMIVAQALCENIKDNKLAQEIVASGFKDTTRLALSNTEMASDMVTLNNQNILNSFNSFVECFNKITQNCDYKNKAEEIKEFRNKLYS